MAEENKPKYDVQSRGYKTKGYSYKDRYINDKMCPECGGSSVYRDEWNTTVSFKCMKRSCRYNWFEQKEPVRSKDCATKENEQTI